MWLPIKMKNEPAHQSTGLRKRIQTWIRHNDAFGQAEDRDPGRQCAEVIWE
jgi:hypothetical protein